MDNSFKKLHILTIAVLSIVIAMVSCLVVFTIKLDGITVSSSRLMAIDASSLSLQCGPSSAGPLTKFKFVSRHASGTAIISGCDEEEDGCDDAPKFGGIIDISSVSVPIRLKLGAFGAVVGLLDDLSYVVYVFFCLPCVWVFVCA